MTATVATATNGIGKCTANGVDLSSSTTTLGCKTFYYTTTAKSFANFAATVSNCVTCGNRKLLVWIDINKNIGKCYDNPHSPSAACNTNYFVR